MSLEEKSDDKSDDDFDSLCKEFEDDSDTTDNVTFIENLGEGAKKDETIAEIDSFLEESIDLRTDILSTICESSTPIRSTFLSRTSVEEDSEITGPRRRKSSGNSDLWSTIDRAVSSAGSDESRPIETNGNESANESIILAGNLTEEQKNKDELAKEKLEDEKKKEEARKKAEEERRKAEEEQLDLSLLEKEKWEEDYEVTGFSVTDIMNEMDDMDITLLYEDDSDSDEDDDKDSDFDATVVAVIKKDEEKAEEKEKTKKERRANTTAMKDTKEWREELMKSKPNKIKQKYYDRAVSVWKKFTQGTDFTIPSIHEVNEPRIYKDKNGALVGYDMPDEFIDNNHPVWQEHRELYTQVMRGQRSDDEFAKYIHTKWGWSNRIEITRNLTSFPSMRNEPKNAGMNRGQPGKGRGEKRNLAEKNADTTVTRKNVFNEMLTIADEIGEVEEDEETQERLKTWRQIQEKKSEVVDIPDFPDSKKGGLEVLKDLPCGYCRNYCMCSPGHKKVGKYLNPKLGKRKRSESVEKSNDENGAKVRKVDYMDEVSAAASRRSGGLDRTAGILGSVAEMFAFNKMYHQGNDNEPWLSEEQARELNSVEDMYDVFKLHYNSPYAKDKRKETQNADTDKSETWDDLLEEL